MTENIYMIRFKPAEISTHTMVAAKVEIHGEHLVLLNAQGKISALFLMDTVESWSQIPNRCTSFGQPC